MRPSNSGSSCYARDYCKLHLSDKCTSTCDYKLILDALFSLSNTPKRYRYEKPLKPETIDKPAFIVLRDFKENILENISEGNWLYIYSSNTGTGKTTWACKMISEYFRILLRLQDTSLENKALYLNTNIFLENLRNAFDNKDTDIQVIMNRAYKCDLLILDDIGVERGTPWTQERLYDLVNTRYNEQKCTIFTSNLSLEEITDRLGIRIGSRLKSATKVELVGGDRR